MEYGVLKNMPVIGKSDSSLGMIVIATDNPEAIRALSSSSPNDIAGSGAFL